MSRIGCASSAIEALDIFFSKPMPTWGADLSGIDFEDIFYYLRPAGRSR